MYAIGQKLGVGGWALVLWGIPLRLVVVYHVTWLVNSATHCWGKAPFESGDSSKNNAWVAALTFGEGWHNTHHGKPQSYTFKHKWFEWDIVANIINLFSFIGLVKIKNE